MQRGRNANVNANENRAVSWRLPHAPVGLGVALRFEGRRAHEELIRQHAQRPDVHGGVVVAPLHHLRRQVIQGATQRRAPRRGCVHGPAKVCDLDVTLEACSRVKQA